MGIRRCKLDLRGLGVVCKLDLGGEGGAKEV